MSSTSTAAAAAAAAAAAEYKLHKQQFYEGLPGTSHWEVFMLAQSMQMLPCLGNALRLWLGSEWVPHRSIRHFLLELASTLLPAVALTMGPLPLTLTFWTLAAAYCAAVLLPLLLIASGTAHHCWRRDWAGAAGGLTQLQAAGALNLGARRKEYITLSRGALMLCTCICIIAVDFHAFPRRWAKAEAYGAGLMDFGVGSLILCSGLVAGGRRGQQAEGARGGGRANPPGTLAAGATLLLRRAAHGVRAALVCLVLGAARLVSVKVLGYQEQVGEYGAHWNFFCTIAVVTLLSHLLPAPTAWLALAVTAVHQLLLSSGMGSWALSAHRGSDLVSLNKEGLASCLGFCALSLMGAALADALHASCMQPLERLKASLGASPAAAEVQAYGEHGAEGRRRVGPAAGLAAAQVRPLALWLLGWAAVDVALWGAALGLEAALERRSRRTCNAPYVAWTAALSLSLLLTAAAAQISATLLHRPRAPPSAVTKASATRPPLDPEPAPAHFQPWLPAAASHSMLAVFLVSNLMTGGLNMSMDTLAVPAAAARAIVAVYITLVAAVAVGLQAWNVVLKFG